MYITIVPTHMKRVKTFPILTFVFLFHISALTVTNTNCTDYDIQLVNNSISNGGKLMMCINGVWGVFCYNSITTNDAQMICKHLGYPSAG